MWERTIVTQCPEPEETRHKEQRAGRDHLDLLIHQWRLSGVELPHWCQLLPCQRVYVTRLPKGQGGFKTGKAASVYCWDKEKHWQRHHSSGLVSYWPLQRKIFFFYFLPRSCGLPTKISTPLAKAISATGSTGKKGQSPSLLVTFRAMERNPHGHRTPCPVSGWSSPGSCNLLIGSSLCEDG